MPIDPSIPLSFRPPEFTPPVQTIGNLMAIRGQIADLAYKQAEAQRIAEQTANEEQQRIQRERTNQSVSKLTELMGTPEGQSALAKGNYAFFHQNGITPDVLDPVVKNHQAEQENVQKLRVGDAAYAAEGRQRLKNILEGLSPDSDQNAVDQYNSAILGLSSDHPELSAKLPKLTVNPQVRNQIKDIASSNEVYREMLEDKAALDLKNQQATEAGARGKQAQAAADEAQIKINMMKGLMEPGALEKTVADTINPQLHPEAYATALGRAHSATLTGDPKEVHAAIQDTYKELVQSVERQKNLEPGEIDLAKKKGAIEVGNRIAGEVGAANALANLSPEAFRGVKNPQDREASIKEAIAARTAYSDVLNQTQQTLDTINAEKSGNKVAGSALTVDMARSMISNGRQLGTALRQVSANSGNLMDKIEGRLKGLGGTDHIPSDIVRDIGAFTVVAQQAAKRKYNADLENLKLRGVDVSKIPEPTSQHSIGDKVRTPDGKVGVFKGVDAQGNAIVDVP